MPISNQDQYTLQTSDGSTLTANCAEALSLDLVQESGNQFHILKDKQAFKGEIIERNFLKKTYVLDINGNRYEVKIGDKYDQLVQQLGFSTGRKHQVKEIKAPMPGLVLDLKVAAGTAFEKGDALLILEAMKMENIIRANTEGVVKSVHIEKGNAVEKGQILIELE